MEQAPRTTSCLRPDLMCGWLSGGAQENLGQVHGFPGVETNAVCKIWTNSDDWLMS